MRARLRIEVPCASFRKGYAREYLSTYDVPPFSTVYGMLLSFVGEADRLVHRGARLTIGMLSVPKKSRVLRTVRRWKETAIAAEANARPDFQELLTQLRFVVLLDEGSERERNAGQEPLVERVLKALRQPSQVDRFGGLSLGESRDLVDVVAIDEVSKPVAWILPDSTVYPVVPEFDGADLTLPVWVDHVGSNGTVFQNCSAVRVEGDPEPELWATIPVA